MIRRKFELLCPRCGEINEARMKLASLLQEEKMWTIRFNYFVITVEDDIKFLDRLEDFLNKEAGESWAFQFLLPYEEDNNDQESESLGDDEDWA